MPMRRLVRGLKVLGLLLALLCPAIAVDPPTAAGDDQARYKANLARWNSLTPEQRQKLREIARRVPPERVKALRQVLRRLEKADEPTRAALIANSKRFAKATPERRQELMRRFQAFRAKPAAERERIRRMVWLRLTKRLGYPVPLLDPGRRWWLQSDDSKATDTKAPPVDRSGWRKAPPAAKPRVTPGTAKVRRDVDPAARKAARERSLRRAKERQRERATRDAHRPSARPKPSAVKPAPPKSAPPKAKGTVDRSGWRKGSGPPAPGR